MSQGEKNEENSCIIYKNMSIQRTINQENNTRKLGKGYK